MVGCTLEESECLSLVPRAGRLEALTLPLPGSVTVVCVCVRVCVCVCDIKGHNHRQAHHINVKSRHNYSIHSPTYVHL